MARKESIAKIKIITKENFAQVGKSAKSATRSIFGMSKATESLYREEQGVAATSSNMTKEFSKMSQGIGGLVHVYAIFAANIFAVSAAFRALSEAADYSRMIQATEQLSIKTGIAFKGIAKGMVAVSAGALNMKSAMQQASLGIAAGLSGKQMQNITKLATQAAIALGRNVPDAINRLSLAIIKGEPELTDELGIILRLKKATEDYAKAHGKTAKDLTAFERSQAVYEQGIKRGTAKYGDVEVTTQSFELLEAAVGNFSKTLLSFIGGVLDPFVRVLSKSSILMGVFAAILSTKLLKAGFQVFSQDSVERVAQLNKHMDLFIQKRAKIDDIASTQKLDREETVPYFEKEQKITSKAISKLLPKKLINEYGKFGKSAGEAFSEAELKEFHENLAEKEKALKKSIKDGQKLTTEKQRVNLPYKGENYKIALEDAKLIRNAQEDHKAATDSVRDYNMEREKGLKDIKNLEAQRIRDIKTNAKTFGAGFAAQKLSLGEMKKEATKLTNEMGKSNKFVKMNVRNTIKWGYATERVSTFMSKTVGVVSTLATYLAIFTMVLAAVGFLARITGVWTGKLSDAEGRLTNIDESAKNIEKTMGTIFVNPKGLDQVVANMKKISNIIAATKDNLESIVSSYADVAELSQYEGLWSSFKGLFTGKDIGDSLSIAVKREANRAATIGSKYFSKQFLDLQRKTAEERKIIIDVAIEDPLKRIKEIKAAIIDLKEKREDLEGFAGGRTDLQEQQYAAMGTALDSMDVIVGSLETSTKGWSKNTKGVHVTQLKMGKVLNGINTMQSDLTAGREEEAEHTILVSQYIDKIAPELGIAAQLQTELTALAREYELAIKNILSAIQSVVAALSSAISLFGSFQGQAAAATIDTIDASIASLKQSRKDRSESQVKDEEYERKLLGLTTARADAQAKMSRDRIRTLKISMRADKGMDKLLAAKASRVEINDWLIKQGDKITAQTDKILDGESSIRAMKEKQLELDNTMYAESIKNGERALKDQRAILAVAKANLLAIEENAIPYVKSSGGGGGGGGGSAKPTKVSGMQAQIDLEKLKAIQVVFFAAEKSLANSFKDRAEASQALYDIEESMHQLRLGVIEGNIKDAIENVKRAKDDEAVFKAKLQYQKALTVQAVELANQEQIIYDRRKKAHETAKQATKDNPLDVVNLGKLWAADLTYAFQDMMLEMDSVITQLTTVTMNLLDGAANSIADAIVDGTDNFAEVISEVLRESAKSFISDSIKMVGNLAMEGLSGLFSGAADAVVDTTATITQTAALVTAFGVQTGALLAGTALQTSALVAAITVSGITGSIPTMAKGGILNHVNAYSSGGITTGAELALIGEGKNTEAIVPLPDNKSIPVILSGGGSGDNKVTTNIVINNGQADVSSESQGKEAKALSSAINVAVRRILVNERRSGGILT